MSETSHTSVYLLRVSYLPYSYVGISLASFRAWMDPTSKKWGHCDITAHTVLLYVLFCLTYMYCTLYVLYILHTVHTVHVPCFPVSDVEVSSSTSVRALVHTLYIQVFTLSHCFTALNKHHSYSLISQCLYPIIWAHHNIYIRRRHLISSLFNI